MLVREATHVPVRTAAVDAIADQKSLGSVSRHAADGATRLRARARFRCGRTPERRHEVGAHPTRRWPRSSASNRLMACRRSRSGPATRWPRAGPARSCARSKKPRSRRPSSPRRAMTAEDRERAQRPAGACRGPRRRGRHGRRRRPSLAETRSGVGRPAGRQRSRGGAGGAVRCRRGCRARSHRRTRTRARRGTRARAHRGPRAGGPAAPSARRSKACPARTRRTASPNSRCSGTALPPIPAEYAASLTRRFQDACRAFGERERRAGAGAPSAGAAAREPGGGARAARRVRGSRPRRWSRAGAGCAATRDVLREFGELNPAAAQRVEQAIATLEEKEQRASAGPRTAGAGQPAPAAAAVPPGGNAGGRRVALAEGGRPRARATSHGPRRARPAADQEGSTGHPDTPRSRCARCWRRASRSCATPTSGSAGPTCRCRKSSPSRWRPWPPRPDLELASRKMRELQGRWKEVALAPRTQGEAMWQRFKTAQDAVFAKTSALMAAQQEERGANLAKKQSLCEQAEALSGSSDWVKTASAIQALQAEWKTIGPVSRGSEKATWERFRAACDAFFTRRHEDLKKRKDEWSANLARKEALCAAVEALAEVHRLGSRPRRSSRSSRPSGRASGPVRKSKSKVVWQRFRTACDAFFERYKHRDQIALQGKAAPRDEVIRELEALLRERRDRGVRGGGPGARWPGRPRAAGRGRVAAGARAAARRPAGHGGALPRRACRSSCRAWPDAFAGTDLDPVATRKRMEVLIGKVEQLLAAAAQSAPGQRDSGRAPRAAVDGALGREHDDRAAERATPKKPAGRRPIRKCGACRRSGRGSAPCRRRRGSAQRALPARLPQVLRPAPPGVVARRNPSPAH